MTLNSQPNGRLPLDYHMHTNLSCDSRATMAEMCRSALAKGLHEVSFTEHFDVHPLDSCTGYYQPDRYFSTLDAVRREFEPQGLTVRAGVEVGEIHRWPELIQPVLEGYPYDLVLGSLHWVGDLNVFDNQFYRAAPPEDTIPAYFIELEAMARHGGFEVLSHPDVIKRVAYAIYGGFEIGEWEAWVRPVWQACIEQGIAIEINTASLRLAIAEAHPGLNALRWYREMGGELLTLGSDGHRPDHVGFRLAEAVDLARAAGFERVCSFEQRRVAKWTKI
jgi:histidinol-phosphatase (PHP family)